MTRTRAALKYLDGRLVLGSRGFSLEAGYLLRTQVIAGKDSTLGLEISTLFLGVGYHLGLR